MAARRTDVWGRFGDAAIVSRLPGGAVRFAFRRGATTFALRITPFQYFVSETEMCSQLIINAAFASTVARSVSALTSSTLNSSAVSSIS